MALAITASLPTLQAADTATLAFGGAPVALREALSVIAQAAGVHLEAADDLREQKVQLFVDRTALISVRDQLTDLLGAQWEATPDGRGRRLTRTSATSEWRQAYQGIRAQADQQARASERDFLLDQWQLAFREIDLPEDQRTFRGELDAVKARFLATLPRSLFEQTADFMAQHKLPRRGFSARGAFLGLAPPVLVPVRDLPAHSQEALVAALLNPNNPPENDAELQRRLGGLPESVVALTSPDGVTLAFQIFRPDGQIPGYYMPISIARNSTAQARIADEAARRGLANLPAAKSALLGASITRDGSAEPAASVDSALAMRRTVPPPNPTRAEFLQWMNRETGLIVIADSYTLSERGSLPPATIGEVLHRASSAFGTVFRQEGDFLLARRVSWPDDDQREFPAPHPQDWLTKKAAGKPLSIGDVAALATGTDDQLLRLLTYSEPNANLRLEINKLFDSRPHRELLATVALLSDEQMQAVRGPGGAALKDLPAAIQEAIPAVLYAYPRARGAAAVTTEVAALNLAIGPGQDRAAARTGRVPRPVIEMSLMRPGDGEEKPTKVMVVFVMIGVE